MRTTHVLAMMILLLVLLTLATAACENAASVSVPEPSVRKETVAVDKAAFPMPSSKPQITDQTKAFYEQKCATCHGAKGDGKGPQAALLTPKPTDFTNAAEMRKTTPLQFYQVITGGEGAMPGHTVVMTAEDRWGLVFYVRSFVQTAGDLATGQTLYRENCSVCHGLRGLGAFDGPEPTLAKNLMPQPRNFNEFAWMADKPDQRFFDSITNGRQWTAMPAWGGTLAEADRWKIIHYLRTFTYTP